MLSQCKERVSHAFTIWRRCDARCGKVAFWSLLVAALALLGSAAVVAIDPRQAEEELIVLTNVDRTSNGVQALVPDGALKEVAHFRSDDMVTRGYFSHSIPPDGHQVFDILDARGIRYSRAGENLGRNNSPDWVTVETVEQAFMNSPQHRAILLWPDYTNLGTGVAESSEGMKIYTVLFTQAPPSVPTETPAPSPTVEPSFTPVPSPTVTEAAEPAPTGTASATATPTPSPAFTPSTTRVELPPTRSMGLIEQIVRRILSLFLNLG